MDIVILKNKNQKSMSKKEEVKLIGKVLITEEEVSEAFSYLYDKYGPTIQLWSDERKTEEVSNYWLDRGKPDMSMLKEAEC